MLRQGPIPLTVHGLLEYLAGAALIVSSFVLDFEDGAATASSIALGVVVIAVAAMTAGPTGLIEQIPRSAHVVIDFLLVAVLIASPFAFGFSDDGNATALFIGLGVLHLLVTVGTRFLSSRVDGPSGSAAGGEPPAA